MTVAYWNSKNPFHKSNDDSIWGGAVESMTIQEKGKAVVRFKGGIEIEVE